jgi:hypothetical protein
MERWGSVRAGPPSGDDKQENATAKKERRPDGCLSFFAGLKVMLEKVGLRRSRAYGPLPA